MKLSAGDLTLLEIFGDVFAGDSTTNLYKMFVDSKSKVMDIGATGVFNNVDRDQQTKIACRSREILPRAGRREDRGPVRHGDLAVRALVLAPVFDRGDAGVHLLFERRDRFCHRPQWIERRGRHRLIHPIVKIFDPELRLFGRKIAVV